MGLTSIGSLLEKTVFGAGLTIAVCEGGRQLTAPNEPPSKWWMVTIVAATASLSLFGFARIFTQIGQGDAESLLPSQPTISNEDEEKLTKLSRAVNELFELTVNDPNLVDTGEKILKIQAFFTITVPKLKEELTEKDEDLRRVEERSQKALQRVERKVKTKEDEIENLQSEINRCQLLITLFRQQISQTLPVLSKIHQAGPVLSILQSLVSSESGSACSSAISSPQRPSGGVLKSPWETPTKLPLNDK